MKAIQSKYRSTCVDKSSCPLMRDFCIETWAERPRRCKYYDHMVERRDKNGWAGFTIFCSCEKAEPVQLSFEF